MQYITFKENNNQKRLIDFQKIMLAWMKDTSQNDIYHMILQFIKQYKQTIQNHNLIEDISKRMRNNDETNDIVEDFIYGYKYEKLRLELSQLSIS